MITDAADERIQVGGDDREAESARAHYSRSILSAGTAERKSQPLPARDFLFVQSTTEIGGAESVLLNLFKASEELRRRSLVATLGYGNGDLPAQLRRAGALVLTFKMPRLRYGWRLIPVFRELRALVRGASVRAIVGNGAHPSAVGGVLARLSGVRSVSLVHQICAYPLRANDPRLVGALLAPCDLLIAVSRAAETAVAKLRPKTPHALVYNGTPLRDVSADEADSARSELGTGPFDTLIGVFGRLQRTKGQDVLIEAFARIAAERPHLRLAIVGGSVFGLEPEYADELKAAVERLGLAQRTVFTGFRTDVPRLMAACDIVCNPSRAPESFGMAIVEAMMLGRPVVAAAGGGPSEIVASDEHGLLVPPDDVAALAAALASLADDRERRRRIGEAARTRARAHFSSEVMAATLLRRLDELVSR